MSLPGAVTPAKAGDQNCLQRLDFGLRRNDAPGVLHYGGKLKLTTLICEPQAI